MRLINRLLPHSLIGRLTFVNVVIIAVVISASSLAVYNTACSLAEGLADLGEQRQLMFNRTLAHYLLTFIVTAIVAGGVLHFYLTKKLIKPVRELIEATKQMRTGQYPESLPVRSSDELGLFVEQYNALLAQLKQNDRQRHKLVQDLSHEFRTPLANLNGYLKAMKDGNITGDRALYEALFEESNRLTAMVEQLDKLKEWDHVSQYALLERNHVHMHDLIKQCVAMFNWMATKKGITINLSVSDKAMWLNHDGIQQVISNLLDNAIRYHVGVGPIEVTGETFPGGYRVTVSGPSTPIVHNDKVRIFERFFRVDESRNRATGGSGLGLSIAREIVLQHGGNIDMTSNTDTGLTRFTVELLNNPSMPEH